MDVDIFGVPRTFLSSLSNYFIILDKNEKKILKEIFENGPNTPYGLSKKLGIGYTTAHRKVNLLEKHRILRLHKMAKASRGGITKEYTLTPNGVLATVSSGEIWHNIDNTIGDKWKDISPFFFYKWSFFRQASFIRYFKKMIEQMPSQYGYCEPLFLNSSMILSHDKTKLETAEPTIFELEGESWEGIIEEYEEFALDWILKLNKTAFFREALEILMSDDKLRDKTKKYLQKKISAMKHYDMIYSLFSEKESDINNAQYKNLFWVEELIKVISKMDSNNDHILSP